MKDSILLIMIALLFCTGCQEKEDEATEWEKMALAEEEEMGPSLCQDKIIAGDEAPLPQEETVR